MAEELNTPGKPVKRRMQDVSFSNVDDLLEYLPDEEKKIVVFLRSVILDVVPEAIEKLSYNVPFYKRKSTFCFIWPGSVSWGGKKNAGVRLGFTNGYLMRDEIGYLEKGNRKQVYWKDFFSLKEIDTDLLKAYIFEALNVDETRKASVTKGSFVKRSDK